MASVRLEGVWKLFGDVAAVRALDLDIHDGEFLVLVGPSGCGKTTTLRMLGGLEVPSYGRIWMGDSDVTLLSPGRRDVAMVFQSYALYPHMTVYKNLAFGPRVRRESKQKARERIREVAEVLGISDLLNRRPAELSGGQRQRVALGRSMIREPQLFLLDEPLSNLDAALRVQMRTELVRLHNLLSVTTIYVTHDQVEALTMGDRVAVFNGGELLQIGTPEQLYSRPANLFVGTFIGSPKMNIFPGRVRSTGSDEIHIECLGRTITIRDKRLIAEASSSDSIKVGIRPHDLHWAAEAPRRCAVKVPLSVEVVEHTGSEMFVEGQSDADTRLMARLHRSASVAMNDQIELALDAGDLHLFAEPSGESLIDHDDHVSSRVPRQVPVLQTIGAGAPQTTPSTEERG